MSMPVVVWSKFNIIYSGLDAARIARAIDPIWIKQRFELWKRFNFASLQNQTHSTFMSWLLCNEASKDIIYELFKDIKDDRFKLIFYPSELQKAANEVGVKDHGLFVRLDSDDAYMPTAIDIMVKAAMHRSHQYYRFIQGYCLNILSNKVHEWNQTWSPFYGKIWDHNKIKSFNLGCSHSKITNKIAKILPGRMFVVSIHDSNTSTTDSCMCIGRRVDIEILDNYIIK